MRPTMAGRFSFGYPRNSISCIKHSAEFDSRVIDNARHSALVSTARFPFVCLPEEFAA